jgi:serine/threonine protein kinase
VPSFVIRMTVQMPTAPTPPDFGPSTEQLDTAQNRDALTPGTMLGGHQIVDVLSADDFGIVYLALDQSLQRQVAIKEYLPTMLARRRADLNIALRAGEYAPAFNEGLRAFIRESETLSRINHPSLLDVTRSWETHGTAYRMMPFYSGQPISEVLPTLAQPPDEPWLRRLLGDLLGALQTLHTAGWHHLNVAPQRILLQADGRPVLLGLGSVRRAIEARKPASIRLDPAAFDYAPPELLEPGGGRGAPGPWSDLFSLAAVFHHMIVGRAPLPAPLRMRGDRMPPLATTVLTLAANYPGLVYSLELTGTLTRALALNPGDRPQSVAAFLSSLDTPAPRASPDAATGLGGFDWRREPGFEPSEPRETSSVEPIPRKRSALRWALPLVLLGILGGGAWHWHESGGQLPSVDSLGMSTVTPAATLPTRPVEAPATPVPVEVESPPATPPQARPVQTPPAAVVATNEPSPQQVAAASPTPQSLPPPSPAPVVVAPAPVRAAAPAPQPAPAREANRPAPRPAPERAPVRTAAAPTEPDNPRAVCGPRSNFSLTYCMETQCKRPRFQRHPQCIILRERGEIR